MSMADQEECIDDYTEDGSVDLKGNPVLRSKRGGWRACSFVVVYEVFERMAYFGIQSNLIMYLTKKLHQDTVTASNNVTNWVGAVCLTPILGAYIADAHLGRYWTFIDASSIYFAGMVMLTSSVSLPSLKPPSCIDPNLNNCKKVSTLQLAVFYGSLYTLALGTGGTEPNISAIGTDQFDDFQLKEKKQKISFFNWWMFSIFFGILFANTVVVWLQDNVGWTLGFALPTLGLAISIVIFLAGSPFYRHKMPTGSPFVGMAQVIFAAMSNWKVPLPHDPNDLYELDSEVYEKKGCYRIDPTATLRFLSKASIKINSTSPWKLCSVTKVEETKQMIRMLPILVSTFVPSIILAQVNTLFIKQGTTLQRGIGNFEIPPASLSAFVILTLLISVVLYDWFFVKFIQKWTKNPRGITFLQRMGIRMIFHIIVMFVAFLTETHRLSVAREHGLIKKGGQVPLSIFILLPQFIFMGIAGAFLEVAKIDFFYDQAPENMKSLGSSYNMTTIAVGSFLSSFLLSTVSDITKRRNGHGWILNNLNDSHLDYYYAFLALLSFVNFIIFLFISKYYVYRAEVSDSIYLLKEELGSVWLGLYYDLLMEMLREGGSTSRPPMLEGANYPYWKTKMCAFLRAVDERVWMAVEDGWKCPTFVEDEVVKLKQMSLWTTEEMERANFNSKAMHALFNAVSTNQLKVIANCEIAKEAWEKLRIKK
ncbi:protein NRT1/ PTR FAMILY 5.2-like [Humulus lupulus]|uniref:protein NRT1/ PTR FAMILY 5.2-like n=1 Tax=Humulus lupulus TaxID=3486 RepID=UPI002B413C7E|nr:protein NRT1/ PTR FAMILY 5.2-like [Humulus lupulus]